MLALPPKGRKSHRGATNIDAVAGKNLAELRTARGWSREAFAERVGLSWQIISSYEGGKVRFAVSRSADFARVLRIPVEKLFEGTDVFERRDVMAFKLSPEAMELAMAHDAIRNETLKSELRSLARTMAGAED